MFWTTAADTIIEPIKTVGYSKLLSVGGGFWNGMGVFKPSFYNLTDKFNEF